jgi:glycosyltransferase involved in cell wall biosynthesis
MPRVLYIGSGSPWMGGAGFLVRQNLFLRALVEVAQLHLAMFDCSAARRPDFPCELTPLPAPVRKGAGAVRRLIDDCLADEPRMFRGYDLESARMAVAALQPERFDAVFSYRIDFGHFAGVLDHPRLMLDIDDPEHLRWQKRIRATTGGAGDWRTRLDLKKLRRFEHAAVAKAKLSFVCQANDARGWPAKPVVVPNCVDVVENPTRQDVGPVLVFVGNTTGGEQSPNVDALRFFLKDIWPRIHQAMPAARLVIAGASSPAIGEMAAAIKNVELVGFISDLSEIYAQASISVAPIRFGTGTRIKILEALAHACPVVSTPVGAEGIDAVGGREIELAGDAEDFAARCIHLLKHSPERERMGQAGHALAKRLYDRKPQNTRLVKLFGDFLEGSG